MARISGVAEGLRAGSRETRTRERKIKEHVTPTCKQCGGVLAKKKRSARSLYDHVEDFDGACRFCCAIFGTGPYQRGVTDCPPAEARKTLDKLREHGYGMILRKGSFGDNDGTIEIEPGDIFRIKRAGLSSHADAVMENCSTERSKECFSIEIEVGPIPLILWPHEISAISFVTIMELRRAGEIEESYVAQDDATGYFRPTEEMREQIYAFFGPLVRR